MSLLINLVKDRIADAGKDYLLDLQSMPDHMLEDSPGGDARAPYDFTYEVVVVNRRVAARLRGQEPEPWPFEGWAVAPEGFRSKDKACGELQASIDEVLQAWTALTDEEALAEFDLPTGKGTKLGIASLVATHMTYHDGQLNYVQAMNGDSEVHWT